MGDIVKLFSTDFFELFARSGQFFVNFDDFFGHHLVSFLRSANQHEIWPAGQALMTVAIQPQTQHYRFLLAFVCLRHLQKLGVTV